MQRRITNPHKAGASNHARPAVCPTVAGSLGDGRVSDLVANPLGRQARARNTPPRDFLLTLLDYNPKTGVLAWRPRRVSENCNPGSVAAFNSSFAGKPVVTMKKGYLTCMIAFAGVRRTYSAHRLIWKMVTGEEPDVVDHINRIRHDNRWENLRSISVAENSRNRDGLELRPADGRGWVWFDTNKNCWRGEIGWNGKFVRFGPFQSRQEADAHRLAIADAIIGLAGKSRSSANNFNILSHG